MNDNTVLDGTCDEIEKNLFRKRYCIEEGIYDEFYYDDLCTK